MASAAASVRAGSQPGLVFFHSSVSGACRRAEGFLAQVLQRRQNHETFKLYRVAQEDGQTLSNVSGSRPCRRSSSSRESSVRATRAAARLPRDRALPRSLAELT